MSTTWCWATLGSTPSSSRSPEQLAELRERTVIPQTELDAAELATFLDDVREKHFRLNLERIGTLLTG